MIDQLHIKNFLAFPELDVPELKLINLVAGKNSTGKTAILEAMWVLRRHNGDAISDIAANRNFGSLSDLRTIRKVINWSTVNIDGKNIIEINNLKLELGKNDTRFRTLETEFAEMPVSWYQKIPLVMVPSTGGNLALLKLYESIALTSKESETLEIIKEVINPDVIRYAITDEQVKFQLKNIDEPVDISSMGEGVRRVLLIALSLVNAKPGGLLLIDEIETHLHHSVIRKLWKIIFEYAIKWNIQVVATTHSQDAIREMFYEAAANEEYQQVSQVLRLQIGRDGKHEIIQYPYEDLEFMMSTNLEIRGN